MLVNIPLHATLYRCAACGVEQPGVVLEVQQNARARANRYVSQPDLPDDAFIVTCHTLPDDWHRIDPLHESQLSIAHCYCGTCAHTVAVAMMNARARAIKGILSA